MTLGGSALIPSVTLAAGISCFRCRISTAGTLHHSPVLPSELES